MLSVAHQVQVVRIVKEQVLMAGIMPVVISVLRARAVHCASVFFIKRKPVAISFHVSREFIIVPIQEMTLK